MRSHCGLSVLVAVAALVAGAHSSSAKADVVRYVTGSFNDGGTLNGILVFNTYGYLEYDNLFSQTPYSLTTGTGTDLTGTSYIGGDQVQSPTSPPTTVFDFIASSGYFAQQLVLTFEYPVNAVGPAVDPLVVGVNGPSFECGPSWTCSNSDAARYLVSGAAATPVPPALSLIGGGLGLLALMARRKKRKPSRLELPL